MNGLATARRLEPKNRTQNVKQATVNPKPRTLDDVLKEGRGKNPFRSWSLMVDRQVDEAMGKPGVPKDRAKAREYVLAQDRSYWM